MSNKKIICIIDEADLLDTKCVQFTRTTRNKEGKVGYKLNFTFNGYTLADMIIGITATASEKINRGFQALGVATGKIVRFRTFVEETRVPIIND